MTTRATYRPVSYYVKYKRTAGRTWFLVDVNPDEHDGCIDIGEATGWASIAEAVESAGRHLPGVEWEIVSVTCCYRSVKP